MDYEFRAALKPPRDTPVQGSRTRRWEEQWGPPGFPVLSPLGSCAGLATINSNSVRREVKLHMYNPGETCRDGGHGTAAGQQDESILPQEGGKV